jgi:hypothetical protein
LGPFRSEYAAVYSERSYVSCVGEGTNPHAGQLSAVVIRAGASLADSCVRWYQPMRTPQAGQWIAAAHHTNQKMQIGK